MEASNSCKPPRNYSGWDSSYSNCLCLLLSLTGLTLLIVLVTILIPGKSGNMGPVRQVPEDFDPILYEKLLADYKSRTTIKPSTVSFDYAPSYTTSRVPKSIKASKEFQSVKKVYRKPVGIFIPTTSIRHEDTTIRLETDHNTEKLIASSYDRDQASEKFLNSSENSKTSVSVPNLPERSSLKSERYETTEISETTQNISSTYSGYEDPSGTFILDENIPALGNSNKSEKIENYPQQTNEGDKIEQEQTDTQDQLGENEDQLIYPFSEKSEIFRNFSQKTNKEVTIEQEQTDRQYQVVDNEMQLIYPSSETPVRKITQKEKVVAPMVNQKNIDEEGTENFLTIYQMKKTSTKMPDQQSENIVPQQDFKSDKLQEFPQEEYKERYFLKPYPTSSKTVTYPTLILTSTEMYNQTEPSVSPLKNPDSEQTQIEQFFENSQDIGQLNYKISPTTSQRTTNFVSVENKMSTVPYKNLTSNSASQDVLKGNNFSQQRMIVKEKIVKVPCPEPPPICSSNTCKRSASEMIALIDHSSDPCDDFYWYACNGLELNRMEDRSSENFLLDKIKDFTTDDPLEKEFKHLYDSCMDFSAEDNYFYVHNFVEELFNETTYKDSLTDLISKVLALGPRGSNFRLLPIFDLTVDQDVSGSFVPTLTIPTEQNLMIEMNSFDIYEEQCIQQIPLHHQTTIQEIYESYIECSHNIAPYILNLNTTLYTLGFLEYLPKLNRSQKIIDIEQDVQFDVYEVLGAVTRRLQLEHRQSVEANAIYMGLDQLQITYPQVNWTTLLSNLFKTRFSQIKTVRLLFKENLDTIFEFYQNTKFSKIKNLIMAMLLHDLYMDIKIVEHKCTNKNFCLKLSTKLMEDVAAKILVSKITKKDLSLLDEYVGDLVARIKEKFRKFLESTEWLSSNQKQILLEKLEKIKVISNAFNLFFNDGVLSYRNANLKLGKNFAENLLKIRQNKRVFTYEKVNNNPGSVWMYNYNPMATELFTIDNAHQIVIPIGLISKFAVKKRSYLREYEILAKLGFAISKAILSFFNPTNLYAIFPDLKDNDELKNFVEVELADPPLTHFENMFELAVSKKDIKLTINDRFSDDGGLSLAYETFLSVSNIRSDPLIWLNFTSSQLFYLSFAQNFCEHKKPIAQFAVEMSENVRLPSYFRINSAIMNSAPFAEQFGCRVGSSMNPEFKVKAFPQIDQVQVDFDKN